MSELIDILVVEDSADDEHMVRRAFKKANIDNPITVLRDGEQAVLYFERLANGDPDTPRPGVVLLDLKLPRIDGKEVLKEIRKREEFATIPVIILTVSDRVEDVQECFEYGIHTYFKKPITAQNIIDFFTSEDSFKVRVFHGA